jgi:signal transduction histidine kinase
MPTQPKAWFAGRPRTREFFHRRSDLGILRQVWNLLSNAVKFSSKGGKLFITLKRINSHIEISVADRGKGLEADFMQKALDRFSQSDPSTKREHGGLGLGLAIAKQLVELHGGTIIARPAPDRAGVPPSPSCCQWQP